MILTTRTVEEAVALLTGIARCGETAEQVVVCAASYRDARQVAGRLLSVFASVDCRDLSEGPSGVELTVRNVEFRFMPIGDGSRVRGAINGKHLVVVTDSIPEEVLRTVLAKE